MIANQPLRRFPGTSKAHEQVFRTVCQECSVGCGLLIYVEDDRIVDIQGDEDHPVNRGRLCAKGMAFMQGLTHPDRITLPATRNRRQGPFEAMDNWEKGLDLLAERLKRVKDQHGPEALIIGCDPEAGLDFYMGARRFARLWGTPHIYSPLEAPRHDELPAGDAHPWAPSDNWLNSHTLLLVEADVAATHPVAFGRIMEAQRRGAKIVAVDTRFTATMSKADVAIIIKPHSGNRFGLALLKLLLEEELVDAKVLADRFEDAKTWRSTFAAMSLDEAASAIGPQRDEIHRLALLLGRHQPAVLITGKRLAFASHYGVWLTMARAMGWQGIPGGGWYPLESGAPTLDPSGDLEDAPTIKQNASAGVFPYQMNVDPTSALDDPQPKALIGSGDCLSDFFTPFRTLANDMDLVVYFGSSPNRTREMAHMVFPAAAWAENDGLSFSNDGAVQWSPKAVKAGDACRSGLGFWMRLAQRFGWEEAFPWQKANGLADHQAFYRWLLNKSEDTAHLDFDQVLQDGRQVYWHQIATASSKDKFKPLMAPAAVVPGVESKDADAYPLLLQATRAASRTSNTSHWWTWTQDLEPDNAIQIHPSLATALQIENGEAVRLLSADEAIEGSAWINRMVPPWLVWSSRRMQTKRVLIHRKGQSPQDACEILKATQK
jgi:ferredoxin-nitrate reductase